MSWTLVTGGAKRLGGEISKTLASKGHNLVIHYNKSRDEAQKVVDACRQQGVKAESIQGSFNSREETEQFVKEYLKSFSDTAFLVNNVGNYVKNLPPLPLLTNGMTSCKQTWMPPSFLLKPFYQISLKHRVLL